MVAPAHRTRTARVGDIPVIHPCHRRGLDHVPRMAGGDAMPEPDAGAIAAGHLAHTLAAGSLSALGTIIDVGRQDADAIAELTPSTVVLGERPPPGTAWPLPLAGGHADGARAWSAGLARPSHAHSMDGAWPAPFP